MFYGLSPKDADKKIRRISIFLRTFVEKCEKFHQVVDSFLREAKIHKIRTLEELNRYWSIYLEEYYHKNAHDGIREYYESKPSLIGFKVEISYDPSAPQTITIHYPGMQPFTAQPLKIGAFCDKNPTLPVTMQETETESSRFLNVLEKKQEQSLRRMADAISFGQFRKDGDGNV